MLRLTLEGTQEHTRTWLLMITAVKKYAVRCRATVTYQSQSRT
jgi:hypothetical protein